MSMEAGVDGGSMLVPEVVWLSSASMRLVAGFIMFMPLMFIPGSICMFVEGVCSFDAGLSLMSMPGMSGMEGCVF